MTSPTSSVSSSMNGATAASSRRRTVDPEVTSLGSPRSGNTDPDVTSPTSAAAAHSASATSRLFNMFKSNDHSGAGAGSGALSPKSAMSSDVSASVGSSGGPLAFWKKRSSNKATPPTSASPPSALQNVSSAAMAAATGAVSSSVGEEILRANANGKSNENTKRKNSRSRQPNSPIPHNATAAPTIDTSEAATTAPPQISVLSPTVSAPSTYYASAYSTLSSAALSFTPLSLPSSASSGSINGADTDANSITRPPPISPPDDVSASTDSAAPAPSPAPSPYFSDRPKSPTAVNTGNVSPTHSRSTSNSPPRRPLSRTPSRDSGFGSGGNSLNSKDANKKLANFLKLIAAESLELSDLRKLAWNGVPAEVRPIVWKLLLGYVPVQRKRRDGAVTKRREEYGNYVKQYYETADESKSESEQTTIRQIRADIPRTSPGVPFIHTPEIAALLERCLYVFAIRHPASGYVQGMNDLVTPFIYVYLTDFDCDMMSTDCATLSDGDLYELEADCYWSLNELLNGIQDHYTFAQPGIQRQIYKLHELVERIDSSLTKHLDSHNVQFLHFAFRWMNCLLMREMPLKLIVRIWDSYLSEEGGDGFKSFHLYVCAAFLLRFEKQLKAMDFADLVQFLQKMPTDKWNEKDVEMICAQAFVYKSLFHSAQRHFS